MKPSRPFLRAVVRAAPALFVSFAVAGFGAFFSSACAGTPEKDRITEIVTPSRKQFIGSPDDPELSVSAFLEVRCGSLDCHGTIGRPMRIYSKNGLRLDVDGGNVVSGGGATTRAERSANFDAVIGVQPEELSRVAAARGDRPERVYIVSKARGDVAHKGGTVIAKGDSGDRCLTTWLASYEDVNTTDLQACKAALTLGGR